MGSPEIKNQQGRKINEVRFRISICTE